MRNLLVCIIMATFYIGHSSSLEQVVVRKVGDVTSLDCPQLNVSDEYNDIMWNKNTVFFVTLKKGQQVDYARGTPTTRITLNNKQQLVVADLEISDSGNYSCQIYVSRNGSWELRESIHMLTVQDVPGVPGKPEVTDIQSRQVTMTWTPSDFRNSPISEYILTIRECDTKTNVWEVSTHKDSLELIVDGLSPYTCYRVSVSAVNGVGRGNESEQSNQFLSGQEAPSAPPLNFRTTNVTSSEIGLEWEAPTSDQIHGKLEGYVIQYGKDFLTMQSVSIADPSQTTTVLTSLEAFTLYNLIITAKNGVGSGPESAMVVETKEGLPSKPRITHISNQQATSFYVNWEPPREINGRLIQYELQWIHEEEVKSRVIAGHLISTMTAFISDLSPYTAYKIQVAAVTNGGRGPFSDQFPSLTDVAAPGPPRNFNVSTLGLTSLHLSWDEPLVYYKNIDNYIIKVFNNRGNDVSKLVIGSTRRHVLTNLVTNSRYSLKVAAITNAIFSNNKWVGDFTDTNNIVLGDFDEDNKVIWDVASHVGNKPAPSGVHPGIIAGILCGILILIVFAALIVGYRFYTCRKCYQAAYLYLAVPSNGQSVQATIITVEEPSEEKQYPDIDVADFTTHVKHMHADGDIGFSQEFDEINRTSFIDKYPCDSSNLPDNRNKNRYINIVAYDHSRVILKTELGRLRQSDYINANYVDGYKKPKAYIATQGPLPQTFPDFWRMVWEQNTNVIVMITNLMEKGRRKCDQYWPNDGAETYGSLSVKLLTTVPRAHYTVRVFTVRNLASKKRHSMKGGAERTVYHYHYTQWPDHGVPDYSLPVLSFVQKSAAQSGPENGPIIVHCSAGVGRTGTYILIDSMIAQIKDQRTVNIPGFTQHIRRQRNFLVQTEDQYIFIHKVLVEYLLGNGVTEVKDDQMSEHLSALEQPANGVILQSITDSSLLERQFKQITEYSPSELDLSAALKPINQEKNRPGSILPVNLKRVLLPTRPGIDGSDYINATYLQGYKKCAEFIVTQHPTEDTMEDFWRMVWDKNSPVIVVLSPFDDLDYKEFWPPKGSSIEVDSGNFRLVMKDEPISNDEMGIVTSEFILDSIQYDYTLMTRILCVTSWPQSCTELHQVLDAIIVAHSYLNSLECGPIIVMDRFGGLEAGTFCALWTLRDQLLSERCADFYQVCKLYHYKRPNIFISQDNYLFLHQVMESYCKHIQDEPTANGSSPRHHHNLFHHGSTRRNGTLPRPATHTNNCNSNTLPRSSAHMGRSSSRESNNISTTPTPDDEVGMCKGSKRLVVKPSIVEGLSTSLRKLPVIIQMTVASKLKVDEQEEV